MRHITFVVLNILAICELIIATKTSAAPLNPKISLPEFVFDEYPPETEITFDYVNNKLVTSTLEKIQKVASSDILSIPPTIRKSYCGIKDTEKSLSAIAKSCNWQLDQCTRDIDTENFTRDYLDCVDDSVWSMTFDDGPNDGSITPGYGTDDVLEALDVLKSKATFFLIGSNIINTPGGIPLVKKIIEKGHRVGLHTWSHSPLTTLTNEQIVAEFLYTESAIAKATDNAVRPSIWRPPCGDVDDRVRTIASAMGYTNIMWSNYPNRDSGDSVIGWNADEKEVNAKVRNMASWFNDDKNLGFISLQHDVSFTSVKIAKKFFATMIKSPPGNKILNVVNLNTCNPGIPTANVERDATADEDDNEVHLNEATQTKLIEDNDENVHHSASTTPDNGTIDDLVQDEAEDKDNVDAVLGAFNAKNVLPSSSPPAHPSAS